MEDLGHFELVAWEDLVKRAVRASEPEQETMHATASLSISVPNLQLPIPL